MNRIGPYLQQIEFPLLLGGHTANLREEQGDSYRVERTPRGELDPSWRLATFRTLSVYRHLLSLGLDPEKLKMQAFGRFRPKVDGRTPEGRSSNRRVDIVLDKRNGDWLARVEGVNPDGKAAPDSYKYKDFRFDLNGPADGV